MKRRLHPAFAATARVGGFDGGTSASSQAGRGRHCNDGASNATVLFVNVQAPANPTFIGQLDIAPGNGAGSDPVGLTVVKDGAGQQRYLLVTAGGPANKEVRFYRSPVLSAPDALEPDPASWEEVGAYSDHVLTTCLGGVYVDVGTHTSARALTSSPRRSPTTTVGRP